MSRRRGIATGCPACQKQSYESRLKKPRRAGPDMGCGRRDRNRIFLHCEAFVFAMAHLSYPTVARRGGPLAGAIRVPGDKSISHRALMLGALAIGRTEIAGLLEGEDVLATAAALNALGASVTRGGDGRWTVHGIGVGGLAEPEDLLDLGNSGTAARLLLGILATHPITAFVTGDASLRRRPMGRV